MGKIMDYINGIGKERFRSDVISVHLYNKETNQNLFLFNYDEYQGKNGVMSYCHMLCIPKIEGENYYLCDINMPFIQKDLDDYFSGYEVVKDSIYTYMTSDRILNEFSNS